MHVLVFCLFFSLTVNITYTCGNICWQIFNITRICIMTLSILTEWIPWLDIIHFPWDRVCDWITFQCLNKIINRAPFINLNNWFSKTWTILWNTRKCIPYISSLVTLILWSTFNLLSFFLKYIWLNMTKNVPSCKILNIFSETRRFK